MSQQPRVPQRLTIERLIHFLRGQPQSKTPPPPPPALETRVTPIVAHPEAAAPEASATHPKRVAVERLVGHLRTTGPLESAIILGQAAPSPNTSPVPSPKPISHAPFYDHASIAVDHEYPTHPVRPDRVARPISNRPTVSTLKNPDWLPDGYHVLLRAVTGQQLGTFTLTRDVLLGRADPKPEAELKAERVNLSLLVPDTASISRIHAMLRLNDARRVQVVDMGSTNGTYLNRQRLEPFKPAVLKDGDEVQLGIFRLRVHFVRA